MPNLYLAIFNKRLKFDPLSRGGPHQHGKSIGNIDRFIDAYCFVTPQKRVSLFQAQVKTRQTG
ncbi:hypothetical protein [Paraburkholderia caffeinilytica]|uniref:hypothetical protein n=1 Tax=Paraburkholderia caffeinilytica TaxID=1761016 RepID=UPI003DA19128